MFRVDYQDCSKRSGSRYNYGSIIPKNDAPKLDSLPDPFAFENDSLWLKFGPYASDVDNETLTFTVKL